MSYGKMMAMRSGKNNDGRRSDRRYSSPRNEYDGGMRDEYDGGIYNYDRYRYSDGRFAPKGRGHRTRAEMDDGGIYDSFYDRDGRRHYDNGRYAPMRNEYDGRGAYSMIGFDTRSDSERRRDRERENYFDNPMFHYGKSHSESGRELGHAAVFEGEDGEYYIKGSLGGKKAMKRRMEEMPEMDKHTAEKWVSHMDKADGSGKGGKWTMEQTTQLMKQKGYNFDPAEFYAVINMLHSDYGKTLTKYGINNVEAYAELAKDWIDDDDVAAGDEKTAIYYECIVK